MHHRWKKSKDKVTLLLATNMNGIDKLTSLMIRKCRSPGYFIKIKPFLLFNKANIKAWVTSEIFTDWLKERNKNLCKKKKKIILFISQLQNWFCYSTHRSVKSSFLSTKVHFKAPTSWSRISQNFQRWIQKRGSEEDCKCHL